MPKKEGAETYLSDLSERDKPWDARRAMAEKVQALYSGTGYNKRSIRILGCSRVLAFVMAAKDNGEKRLRLARAHFCRVRECPVCQWRKSMMWVARALKGLPQIQKDYPKARWIFLTLTVKNVPIIELRLTVKEMNKAFSRLTKRVQWKPILGFARSLEVTRSAKGEAHPHFHVLMMVRPSYFSQDYVKQQEWRELWQSCMKVDYLPVVNVKTVKPKPGADPENALADAIRETFKYAVKPQDLVADQEWLLNLTQQMQNSHAVNIGGVLKQYWKNNKPDGQEDLIHGDDDSPEEVSDDDLELYFGWRENTKRYALID